MNEWRSYEKLTITMPGVSTKTSFGDELRAAVAKKEAEWQSIPESYRADLKREEMDEFKRGWDAFTSGLDGLKVTMMQLADAGQKQMVFAYFSADKNVRLPLKELGKMRALTKFLLENGIEYTHEWDRTTPYPRMNVVAKWN